MKTIYFVFPQISSNKTSAKIPQFFYAPLTHPLQWNHYCQNHIGARAEIAEIQKNRITLKREGRRYANVFIPYKEDIKTRIILSKSRNFYCVPNWRLCKLYRALEKGDRLICKK